MKSEDFEPIVLTSLSISWHKKFNFLPAWSSFLINSNEPLKIAKKIETFRGKNVYLSNKKILKKFDIKEITKKYESMIDDII